MNSFLMEGILEFRRKKALDAKYESSTRRLQGLVNLTEKPSAEVMTLLLTPLIEVAWTDGKVGRAEQNAILRAAEKYGLLEKDETFLTVLDRMTTRPSEKAIECWWGDIYTVLAFLPLGQTAAICSLMLEQTHYIAELGQKRVFGSWRGYSSGHDEILKIKEMEARIARVQNPGIPAANGDKQDLDFLKLLPLVKVAWADGRITRREREMIFDSMIELGVEPTDENLKQLLKWLELSPNDEFFNESLKRLYLSLEGMDADQRANEKYSLISKCTEIAEASGGNRNTPSGGRRICDEEVKAVKHIARLLNGAISRTLPPESTTQAASN